MIDLMREKLLTLEEVAEVLRVELQTVRNWCNRATRQSRGLPWLDSTKIGGIIRTSAEALQNFATASNPEPIPSPSREARIEKQRRAATVRGLQDLGVKGFSNEHSAQPAAAY